jgi:ArsR family transcriptional regulator
METTNRIRSTTLEKAAYILKCIGHPARLAIIELLSERKEITVNEICHELGMEQSLISHHLVNMKIRGLLSSRKEGINIYYALKERNLLTIITCVQKCDCNM